MEMDAVGEELGVGGDHLGEDYRAGGPQVEFNAFKTIAAQSHDPKISSYFNKLSWRFLLRTKWTWMLPTRPH